MRNFFLKDDNVLILIFLNSIVIFASGFDFSKTTISTLSILDGLFTIAFIIEAIVKIKSFGVEAYFQKKWNVFDFILIVISLPSLLIIFFQFDLFDMSYLLAFRTLRAFKVVRFFNFIPGIGNLLRSIKRGFKASILILVAFSVFLFVISVLSNNLFKESEIFSDPATSMYTMLQLISLEGWYEIPEKIVEDIPTINVFFTRLYFVVLLIIGGIFGLSFVDAVLVDSMVMDNTEGLEGKVEIMNKELQEIKTLLKEIGEKDN